MKSLRYFGLNKKATNFEFVLKENSGLLNGWSSDSFGPFTGLSYIQIEFINVILPFVNENSDFHALQNVSMSYNLAFATFHIGFLRTRHEFLYHTLRQILWYKACIKITTEEILFPLFIVIFCEFLFFFIKRWIISCMILLVLSIVIIFILLSCTFMLRLPKSEKNLNQNYNYRDSCNIS